MGMRILLVLGCLMTLGCSSLEKSEECQSLAKQFSRVGLDIRKFRDYTISTDSLLSSVIANGNDVSDDSSYNTGGGSLKSEIGLSEIETLRMEAGNTCGYITRPTRSYGRSASYSSAKILAILSQERKERRDRREQLSKIEDEFNKIPIDRVYEEQFNFDYPAYAGIMKEDAKIRRKAFFQKLIIDKINFIYSIPFYHKQLKNQLAKQTPPALTEATYKQVHSSLLEILKKFDIVEVYEDPSNSKEVVDLNDALSKLRNVLAVNNRDYENGPHEPSPDKEAEWRKNVEANDMRDLIRSQETRVARLGKLLAVFTEYSAERSTDKTVIIKIKIDWPRFFEKYPLKNISEFTE